jgi:tetratricopeptide (TPR) repeat protein
MMRRTFASFTILVSLVLTAGPVRAADNWTGKKVIAREPDVKVQYTAADGTPVQALLRDVIQTVRSEKGTWLEVGNNGDPGWLNKDDVIPLEMALVHFANQLEANPDNAFAYACRGVIYAEKKDLEHALQEMTAAIELDPNNASWYSNRGVVWNDLEEFDRAIADHTEAIRLNPAYAIGLNNRGLAWINKDKYDSAIADFNEAIRLDRGYGRAYLHRGNAWAKKRAYESARADYSQALRIDPKDSNAYNQFAWLLATCPKETLRESKKAVEYATKACELNGWKQGQFMDTLAAAHASNGNFDQAVKWEQKALEDADFVNRSGQVASERLLLFEKKEAYREKE